MGWRHLCVRVIFCAIMITFSHDAQTNVLQVHLDRVGMAELQAKLASLVAKSANGGSDHTHFYDLPPRDLYDQKTITEVIIDYVDDDLTDEAAALR